MYKITDKEFKELRKSNNIFEISKATINTTYYMVLIMDNIVRIWVVQCIEKEPTEEGIRYYFQFVLCPDLSDSKTYQYIVTITPSNALINTPGHKIHRNIKIRTNRNLSNRKKFNLAKMKQYMAGVYSETAFKRLRKVLEPYGSEE